MKRKLLFCVVAILGFMQMVVAEKPVDVTATYLKNFKTPFSTTGEGLQAGNLDRFKKLTDWVTTGNLGTLGTDATFWHHDANKSSVTLTAGWDGFAASFDNMKVFQTVTLPAGKYSFTVHRGVDWSGAKYSFVAAAKGAGMPDTTSLVSALGSTRLSTNPDVVSATFTLDAPGEVSLGVVASFPVIPTNPDDDLGYCVSINKFELTQWIEGINFTALNALVATAESMTADQYPVGLIGGTYPQAKWDAFQGAYNAAKTAVAAGESTTQANVDAKAIALQTAITELKEGMILPFKLSDSPSGPWYQIRDMRSTQSYWEVGAFSNGTVDLSSALIMSQTGDNTNDAQLFRFEAADGGGFYIANKGGDKPLTKAVSANMLEATTEQIPQIFTITKGKDLNHFVISLKDSKQQLNSFVNSNPKFIGFYNDVNDAGNNWEFVEKIQEGATNFAALKELYVSSMNMKAVDYPASQFSTEKWNSFVTVRTSAAALLAKENESPQPSQAEADAMVASLNVAITDLQASYTYSISTAERTTYYFIHDKRSPKGYMKIGTDKDNNVARLLYTKSVPTTDSTAYQFRFERVEEGVFKIYCKAYPETPLSVLQSGTNLIHVDASASQTEVSAWTFGATPANDGMYRTIATQETEARQLNSYQSDKIVGFYAPSSDDPGNDWKFVEVTGSTAVKQVSAEALGVKVIARRVVANDSAAKLSVYTVLGQKVNANAELPCGVYMVQVAGKAGVVKLLVK